MRSFGLEIEGFGDLAIEVEDELSLPRLLQTHGLAGYEPATTAVFIEALWHGPEGAVVDVGANFGLYALVASALSERGVYAIEPYGPLVGSMRHCLAINGLNATVEECAAAHRSGKAKLFLSDTSDTSNSVVRNSPRGDVRARRDVPCLDDRPDAGTDTVRDGDIVEQSLPEPALAEHRSKQQFDCR